MAEISVYNPRDLNAIDWFELQNLSRETFRDELSRTTSEINALVSWEDPERYYLSHIDPNNEVGHAFNAHQEYRYPKVAIAYEGEEKIGFAYSAHNVSGSNEIVRDFKRLSVIKNYLWLREVVVHPDHRRQRVATDLGRALLHDSTTLPGQPISTYIWPSEMPHIQPILEGMGFMEKGTQMVSPFGNGAEILQKTMVARSVHATRDTLDSRSRLTQ